MLPLIKISLVFLLIITLLRQKLHTGLVMLVSTCALGLIFNMQPLPLLNSVVKSLIDPLTVMLIIVLTLIMVMESVMRQTGMLDAMTRSLTELPLNQNLLVAAIPAIIGLLPSAGGARFSAPLVAQATIYSEYSTEDKVLINYWFRHIWEYSLPLYPGLILAAHISGIALNKLIFYQWPISLLWAIIGYVFIFKLKIRKNKEDYYVASTCNQEDGTSKSVFLKVSLRNLLYNTWPLWSSVVLVLANIPIIWALTIVSIALIVEKRYQPISVWLALKEPITLKIALLIWGTMAFKEILKSSEAVTQISNSIADLGIPLVLIVVILPMITGILTGLVQVCIGISFPLLISIIEPSVGFVMLAYVSGVIGVMMSPIHLCFILTVEYFGSNFIKSYKPLLLPSGLIIIFTFGIYKVINLY
ncbi:hypothetical protein SAMN05660649_03534 [Desulfotomaculum arcticum]|uniref:DUF401 family protein n=1 Tax=Desulfotruncus arcticus DSM 17038 TaxID=1121424 RepID=A0A1I2WM68_9FIRM|nr:DUF401 family protein [Desulfotruncus arcticus]SFH02322.1 hypothetical protein SAMN05660649_03534 [Desulfotomaculum arcticum] [Desulfotruncus arcticus DSM 17038]